MDAKVYAMIGDLSREAVLGLICSPVAENMNVDYLRSFLRQQYETGEIEESDIIDAWENDEDDEDDAGMREEAADKAKRRAQR